MAENKKTAKTTIAENTESVEQIEKAENTDDVKNVMAVNGKLSLTDVGIIVNTVADSVFIERNGRIEYAAEIYEVLLAYLEIGAFFPETEVFENSLGLFFIDYIDGKYCGELDKLKNSVLAQYIENAVKRKIEARMKQIENPLFNSLEKFVDTATALAQNYVDDINNVGADDIKKFIQDFAGFAKKTNPQTVADKVMKMHINEMAETEKANDTTTQPKPSVKRQSGKSKKTAE